MTDSPTSAGDAAFLRKAIETTVHIGLVALLLAWCFWIVEPFVVPVVWGVIIAIASNAFFRRLLRLLGQRHAVAAAVFVLAGLVMLITPIVLLSGTLIDSVHGLAQELRDGTVAIPPPPESVGTWPFVGEPLKEFWDNASNNLAAALRSVEPQLKAIAGALLSTAAGAGFGILQFVVAIVIAGALLANASRSQRVAHAVAVRLAGTRGEELAVLAETTIRSVARGILGVALIQSILAGLGFLVAGVPAAGFWALICLLLAVVQIGIVIVLIPMMIYMFSTADTLSAVLFMAYCIPVGVLDNILKPILLGRGVEVPMLVIFIGAIGGFLTSGIIGLFIGAVILSLGYKLFLAWLDTDPAPQQDAAEAAPDSGAAAER